MKPTPAPIIDPLSVPDFDQPMAAPATIAIAGIMYAMAEAFRSSAGGREIVTLSPGLAPAGLFTSICIASPELGWHMLLAEHDPQASDRTIATTALPSEMETTLAVSSSILLAYVT
jgi:hypothetical protein